MLKIDHVIIAVRSLEQAIADYTELGFHVIEGGTHANGATHNALVVFQDGSYLELLALTGDEPDPQYADYSHLVRQGEGIVGYALRADDLETVVQHLHNRGQDIAQPQNGGRTQPDGTEMRWKSAMLGGLMSPFFVEDETERVLRVPDDQTDHPNGATGIARLEFIVSYLKQAVVRYQGILGIPAKIISEEEAQIRARHFTISLRAPQNEDERAYYEQRPFAPHDIILTPGEDANLLEPEHSHRARLWLAT